MRPVEDAALAVGAVLLAIGLLGLIPEFTNDGHVTAGHPSDAAPLGLFMPPLGMLHLGLAVLMMALGVLLGRNTGHHVRSLR